MCKNQFFKISLLSNQVQQKSKKINYYLKIK